MKETYKEINVYEFLALFIFFMKKYKYIFIVSILIGSIYAGMNTFILDKNVKHLQAMVYSPIDFVVIDQALKIMNNNNSLNFLEYEIVDTKFEKIENADEFGRSSISLHPKSMLKMTVLCEEKFKKGKIDSIKVLLNTLLQKNEIISSLLHTEEERLLYLIDQINIIKENEKNSYNLSEHTNNLVFFDKPLPTNMLEVQQIKEKYKIQLNYLKPLVFLTDLHISKGENSIKNIVLLIIVFFFIGLIIALFIEVFKKVSFYKKKMNKE
jgi:hypothetical protein